MSSTTTMQRNSWLTNAFIIAKRDILHWKQDPETVILGWASALIILLIFGSLFGGAIEVPDGVQYYDFLLPGMLAMTMLFGIEVTLMGVTGDAQKGVTDRFLSMPIGASAVVLGRCMADMLNSMIGLALMIGAGLLLGWEWNNGAGSFFAAIGLLLLLRFALLWIGIYIGVTTRSPGAVMAAQILIWPIGFLSSVFVSPATMPAWLATIAEWNPLSATATAIRDLFGNPSYGSISWAGDNALLLAFALPLLITAIFMPLSIRAYRNLKK